MNDFVYHTKQLYCELIAVQIDSFGSVVAKQYMILIATRFDSILTRSTSVSILGFRGSIRVDYAYCYNVRCSHLKQKKDVTVFSSLLRNSQSTTHGIFHNGK